MTDDTLPIGEAGDPPPKRSSSRLPPLLRNVAWRLFGVARRAATWRAPDDGAALSVGTWLVVLAIATIIAELVWPALPAMTLVPPVLALAIAIPLVQRACRYFGEQAAQRWWYGAVETAIVAVAIAAAGVAIFARPVGQGMPIDTGDNQFMMARSELIWRNLSEGRWQHFTLAWQGGDTLTDFYGLTANLLPGTVHWLLPKGTAFVTSYTISVLFGWWLRGVAAYYLARRFSGPHISAIVCFAALCDVGNDVWGGIWSATIYWGMTHGTLALTFSLFAAALQVDLTRKTTTPRMIGCAIFMALAACTHAVGMLLGVILTTALAVATLLARHDRRPACWALVASVFGLMLSAFFSIPLSIGLKRLGYKVAASGYEYTEFGKGLIDAELPSSSFSAFIGFGLIAFIAAILAREIALVATATTMAILLMLCMTPFMIGTWLYEYFPSFLDSQPRRMLTVLKTASIPAIAWSLERLWSPLQSPGSLQPSRVLARAVLLALVLYGPGRLLAAGLEQAADQVGKQIARRDNPKERSHTGPAYRAVFDWIKRQRDEDPSATPWRIMVNFRDPGPQWRHPTWGEGVWTGVPVVDRIQVSSNFLTMRPREFNLEGLRDWAIRYVLTETAKAPLSGLTLAFSSEQLHLWAVPNYDGKFILAPEGVTVSNIERQDERVAFDVAGAPPDGVDIQLRAAWFPRWRAHAEDGSSLRVFGRSPRWDAKPNQHQLVVHAFNGRVRVDCDGTMPGYWLGLSLALSGCAGLVLLAAERRRNKVEDWLVSAARRGAALLRAAANRLSPRRIRVPVICAVVLAAALVSIFVVRHQAKYLLLPPIEGWGVRVLEYRHESQAFVGCTPEWWKGRYRCKTSKATVDSWLGTKASGDASGEHMALWPGMRFVIPSAGTKLQLDFSRIRPRKKKLMLSTSGRGSFIISVSCAGAKVEREYAGEKSEVLPGICAGPILLEVESKNPDSTLVLRGELI